MSKFQIIIENDRTTYTIRNIWWLPMFIVRRVLNSITATESWPTDVKIVDQSEKGESDE